MPNNPTTISAEPNHRPREDRCRSTCPVCSGSLIPLRDALRCVRCSFTFCEGCEGGSADQPGDFGD